MLATNSIEFSKSYRGTCREGHEVRDSLVQVGILALCRVSGSGLKDTFRELGIDAHMLRETDVSNFTSNSLFEYDLVFVTENDKSSLIDTFRLAQTVSELSAAQIILVSSRKDVSHLTEAFGGVYDAFIGFPIGKDTLSYLLGRLASTNNNGQRRTISEDPVHSGSVWRSGWWILPTLILSVTLWITVLRNVI